MRVLVACEYSGTVRDAFIRRGHVAVSCDLIPCDSLALGAHFQGDVRNLLAFSWDLVIAHPPCTYLTVAAQRWLYTDPGRVLKQQEALDFVRLFFRLYHVPRICIENPVSVISTKIMKPTQIVQPHMFGHRETKTTCLWLKGLPKLVPTNPVEPDWNRLWHMSPSKDRSKLRSLTYKGIAEAMASQWG